MSKNRTAHDLLFEHLEKVGTINTDRHAILENRKYGIIKRIEIVNGEIWGFGDEPELSGKINHHLKVWLMTVLKLK